MRETAAACLHEGFKLSTESDDTSKLRQTALELLEDNQRGIMVALNQNIDVIISKYCNMHHLSTIQKEEKADKSPAVGGMTNQTKSFAYMHSMSAGADITKYYDFGKSVKSGLGTI